MEVTVGTAIGLFKIAVGAFCPGSGLATSGAIQVARSLFIGNVIKPVFKDPDLEGDTAIEKLHDLYFEKTDWSLLGEINPF